MIYKLELNIEQAALLIEILTKKAAEIHAWRIATKSRVRDEMYNNVVSLMIAISSSKQG